MNRKIVCLTFLFFLIIWLGVALDGIPKANACAEEEKSIYLTFDDGPSDRITPRVLDVLKEKRVKATFFVVGRNVEKRKELTKRILREGHSIGIHSYTHEYAKIYATPCALLKDIQNCNQTLHELGIYTRLYRFPGGSNMVSEPFRLEVKKQGYQYVDWNALCGDSEIINPTPADLLARAVSSAGERNRIVMLFHDSTDKRATLLALPDIIDHFSSLGYTFKTFDMI